MICTDFINGVVSNKFLSGGKDNGEAKTKTVSWRTSLEIRHLERNAFIVLVTLISGVTSLLTEEDIFF